MGSALAGEDGAIYTALQAVLVVRERVEMKRQEALAVALADGGWEEVAKEGLAVARMGLGAETARRAEEEALEGFEGSHVCGWCSKYVFVRRWRW